MQHRELQGHSKITERKDDNNFFVVAREDENGLVVESAPVYDSASMMRKMYK
jgi:hypothetical protein